MVVALRISARDDHTQHGGWERDAEEPLPRDYGTECDLFDVLTPALANIPFRHRADLSWG
jgi:hypothetical protein